MNVVRQYESTYILNAALEDTEIEEIINRITQYVTEHGGKTIELNKMGRRRLAYPINKKFNGYYVYYCFESPADLIPQLERIFTLDDNFLRHLTLQLNYKLREFRKVRAEAQAARAAALAESAQNDADNRRRERNTAAAIATAIPEVADAIAALDTSDESDDDIVIDI